MYKNILISTDGSELAGKAVKHGANLAKCLGAKVSVLKLRRPTTSSRWRRRWWKTRRRVHKRRAGRCCEVACVAGDTVKAAGVACDTVQVEHEHVYQAIIDTAKSKGCI